jgi:hypothetical protein
MTSSSVALSSSLHLDTNYASITIKGYLVDNTLNHINDYVFAINKLKESQSPSDDKEHDYLQYFLRYLLSIHTVALSPLITLIDWR